MPDVDFSQCSRADLITMAAAGEQIRECYRLLRKGGGNIVAELLRGHDDFFEWEHYPQGDVYDPETHSQYYYHSHPGNHRQGEHGHFHTFLRPQGMPAHVRPAALADRAATDGGNGALSHLIAISMNDLGYPVRLFTTNRWVTGEVWYHSRDVCGMLDRFHMDLAYPSLTVNIWITGMIQLFRPQIERLLNARDQALAARQARRREINAYEDRAFEIASSIEVSVEDQLLGAQAALRAR